MMKVMLVCAVALGILLIVAADSDIDDYSDYSFRNDSFENDTRTIQTEVESAKRIDDNDEDKTVGEILSNTEESPVRSSTTKRPKSRRRQRGRNKGKKSRSKNKSNGSDSSVTESSTDPTEVEFEDGNEEENEKRSETISIEPSRSDSINTDFSTVPETDMQIDDDDGVIVNNNTVCTSPPKFEEADSSVLEGTEHPVGTVVSYQCHFGYVSRSSSSPFSICRLDERTGKAEWTHPNIACIPRSCGDPGYVTNGRRIGNLFTFPNKVEFECQEGYRLKGLKGRYCQAGGEWSGRLPTCDPISCPVPSNPVNGRVLYSSLDYGTELRYECNKGFMLQNHQLRHCTEDGTWSNSEPECTETRCEIPKDPEHGSVQLAGDPKVGSLALYSCHGDTTLFGTATSKCLPSGNWTFDPPKCLHSCIIPAIENGELGRSETQGTPYWSRQIFRAFQVGESVKHDETVIIRCKNGFSPGNGVTRETDEAICQDGKWSKSLQCQELSCSGDPPPMQNGNPVIEKRTHGHVIWYQCHKDFHKAAPGRVICNYGKWEGETPVCADYRCYTSQLNYPGLVKPKEIFLNSRDGFDITCERTYKKTMWKKKILCSKGEWNIQKNPCTIITCEEDPPVLLNGKPGEFSREHGSVVTYKCDEGFDMIGNSSSVQCKFGNWEGKPPACNQSTYIMERKEITESERTRENIGSWNSTAPSLHLDECSCTYDYRIDLLKAYVGNRELEGDHRVRKGEVVSFICRYPGTDIVWPSGLRFFERIDLTCNRCQVWQAHDLPHCETRQSGDSFIVHDDRKMKFLPRGIIEVPKSERITLRCRSSWGQPSWNAANREGIRFFYDTEATTRQTGFYVAHMVINAMDNQHSGRYECSVQDYYGRHYRPTSLELQIKEPEVRCPELQTVTNRGSFIIVYENDRAVNSTARYICEDRSKKVTGASERTCLNTGKWSGSYPGCEDVRCPLLDGGDIFGINYSNHRKTNSVAYYYCKSIAQRIIGSSNRTCLHTGQWSGTNPLCEDITCLEFPTYNGLLVTYSNGTKMNSIARFECSHPTRLVGSTSSRCQYNLTWTNPRPSCETLEIRCPKIEGKGIFSIKYSNDRRINSTAQFFCKATNQKVAGCNVMTCQQNGEWSGDYPTCVDFVTCDRFASSPGLEVTYSDDVRVGSIASFSCSSSTTLIGSSSASCRHDGTWSHSSPSCGTPSCSIPTLMDSLPERIFPDMSTVTEEFLPFGTELRLQCEDSLIFYGNPIATCGFRGRWEYENIQCISGCRLNKDDSSLLIVEPVKDYYRFGEFILLSCPPGLKLTSEVERVMCLEKTWSDTVPDCTEWKETRGTTKNFR